MTAVLSDWDITSKGIPLILFGFGLDSSISGFILQFNSSYENISYFVVHLALGTKKALTSFKLYPSNVI